MKEKRRRVSHNKYLCLFCQFQFVFENEGDLFINSARLNGVATPVSASMMKTFPHRI